MDDGVDMRVVLTNVYSDARSIAITQAHPYVSARHLDRGLTRNQLNKRQMTSGVTFWLVPPPHSFKNTTTDRALSLVAKSDSVAADKDARRNTCAIGLWSQWAHAPRIRACCDIG